MVFGQSARGQAGPAHRRRIVVGVDGSAKSLAGAEFVSGLDLGPCDPVVIATVTEQHDQPPRRAGSSPTSRSRPKRGSRSSPWSKAYIRGTPSTRTAKPVIRHGDPKREILAAARELERGS